MIVPKTILRAHLANQFIALPDAHQAALDHVVGVGSVAFIYDVCPWTELCRDERGSDGILLLGSHEREEGDLGCER
jgi:hypothetical protein